MNIPIQTIGVAVVVLRKRKNQTEVLLLKRQSTILNEAWTYIGGKIEQGEIAPVFVAFVSSKGHVRLNEEHSQFEWCSFKSAKAVLTLPGTEEVLTFIENHFVHRSPLELLKIDQMEVQKCSL